nr:MAG TPA: hypothetical protein [Caudoviricetes sp.]
MSRRGSSLSVARSTSTGEVSPTGRRWTQKNTITG